MENITQIIDIASNYVHAHPFNLILGVVVVAVMGMIARVYAIAMK